MSAPIDSASRAALRETATQWLARVKADSATDADWTELRQWLEESDAHVVAFEEAEKISADEAHLPTPAGAGKVQKKSKAGWIILGLILVAAVGGPFGWHWLQGDKAEFRTNPGETRLVTLGDGSRVLMDSATRIVARQGVLGRHVELGNGQASFDVAAGQTSFIVDVADQSMHTTVGEFNIRHYDRPVDLTVRKGQVRVEEPGHKEIKPVVVRAGQGVQHLQGALGARADRVDVANAYAWTTGRLVFKESSVAEVVADLNHHYAMPITVPTDAALKTMSGTLPLGNEQAVADTLAKALGLTAIKQTAGYSLEVPKPVEPPPKPKPKAPGVKVIGR